MVSIFDKTNNKRSIFHTYNSRIDSKNDAKNTRLNYLNIIEHRRFPVKLTKYLRTFFLQKTFVGWSCFSLDPLVISSLFLQNLHKLITFTSIMLLLETY